MRSLAISAEPAEIDLNPHVPGPVSVEADATEEEWAEYVNGHPDATVDHAWGWRSIIERVFRQQCRYLTARRGGRIVGVLPLVCFKSTLFGRLVVSIPYLNYGGILAADASAADALVQRAQAVASEFGASYLELRNQQRYLPDRPCRQHKVRMALALPSAAEDLWKALDRKVRNQVRKAQKEGLTAESGGASLIPEFYSVFARNMRDLGTPVYPVQLFSETLHAFPGRARVHLVRREGQAVAGAVSVRFRDTVLVPWASSLREYRQLCPNMLLYWSMLEGSAADGARVFDFGRSSAGAGTHQFKLQWGAAEIPQYWEYVLFKGSEVPSHGIEGAKVGAAVAMWRRLPLWLTNTVGPRIIAHVP
jgi:FemAB-related protein (PEP-CTERM system-associated)